MLLDVQSKIQAFLFQKFFNGKKQKIKINIYLSLLLKKPEDENFLIKLNFINLIKLYHFYLLNLYSSIHPTSIILALYLPLE